ncbi:MAG: hypothetical protein ACI9XK_004201 [Granulosicoccus sp.]|jgi:hypothetical protein
MQVQTLSTVTYHFRFTVAERVHMAKLDLDIVSPYEHINYAANLMGCNPTRAAIATRASIENTLICPLDRSPVRER